MTTVVLGWDGLDYELAHEFGVADAFGAERCEIDSIASPKFGKPHTRELWPSMITGVPPSEHGFRTGTDDSLDWSHPLVNLAADVGSTLLPGRVRTELGRHLRNAGAGLDSTGPDTYRERGLSTVFDDRASLALAIPNYWTERSADLGLTSQRKATFRAFMHVGESGGMEPKSDADIAGLEQRIWSAAGEKLAATRAGLARDYDLIWVWLGFLDTVGHVAPALDAGGLQERAYQQAAAWTDAIWAAMQPEDTLVCVSDHGLQDGDHTMTAFLGSDEPAVVDACDTVVDVAAAVDTVTPRDGDPATVREDYRTDSGAVTASTEDVQQQLENLGYI